MEELSGALVDDEAFLAQVTEFLSDYTVPVELKDGDATATADDSLVPSSHQLLAEVDNQDEENQTRTQTQNLEEEEQEKLKKQPVPLDKRREIRNAQAALRRQRHRQKLKDERETLTQQESELSRRLATLQAAQEEARTNQARSLMLGAWRSIAARQLERRLEAEHKQKLLRAEVVGRSRMIEQMNLLLQERLQSQQKLLSCENVPESGEDDGAALFETFLQEMDELYAQTNDVLRGLEFKSSFPAVYELKRKSKDGIAYFDSADRIEFPYAFENAEDAATTTLLFDPSSCPQSASTVKTKDTATMKNHVKYRLKQGKTVEFVICGVVKKYKEKGRLVYVWRGLTEGQGEFDGMQSDETSWIVVRPSRGAESSTILEFYSRMVPVNIGTKSTGDNSIERFVEILAKSGEKESQEMMTMMENLMLNDPQHSTVAAG